MKTIDDQVRAGKFPNAFSLAKDIEVSHRTVLRDVVYMRDLLGMPIEYDGRRHGYYYAGPHFALPQPTLTEGELISLLVGTKVLEQYQGTPFETDLRRAFSRISWMLPDEISVHIRELADATAFAVSAPRPTELVLFQRLSSAVRKHLQLKIVYRSVSSGKTTMRLVDPYKLACLDHGWYLIAFCHSRNEIRMFVPERIVELRETGHSFEPDDQFDLSRYMEGAFRVMRGGKPVPVKLRFNPPVADIIAERRWHPSQIIKRDRSGCVLKMIVSNLDEVAAWVLSFGGSCKVLTPALLKDKVVARLREALAQYAREAMAQDHTKS